MRKLNEYSSHDAASEITSFENNIYVTSFYKTTVKTTWQHRWNWQPAMNYFR